MRPKLVRPIAGCQSAVYSKLDAQLPFPSSLVKQNQDLFADVSELKHNYEMVSELYDEALESYARNWRILDAVTLS